jgi:hypothetical protein
VYGIYVQGDGRAQSSATRLTLYKMAGVRVNWVSLSNNIESIFILDVSPLALESAAGWN